MHSHRIRFLDIMRGVAVVVMVMGHSIDSVLSLDARTTDAFRLYDAVRGFTAPIFLFVSGFVFTVVTERRWAEYLSFSRILGKRLLKILLLLLVGYALHLPFLSLNKLLHDTKPEEYAQLFQADVLHCVAASMLILQIVVLVSGTRHRFALVTLGTTVVIVLATPLVWPLRLAPVIGAALAPFINHMSLSIFPVFPFAAFMLAGAVVGHYFLMARQQEREAEFFKRILLMAFVAGTCGIIFDLVPWALYPPHDYWKASPNFFLLRLGAIFMVTAGFFSIRQWPLLVERPVIVLGQASLFVYAVHLAVVYGSPANLGLQQIVGKTLPYHLAAGVAVAVLGTMIALTNFWNYARTHHAWPSRFVQAGFASTIVYLFFTKPW